MKFQKFIINIFVWTAFLPISGIEGNANSTLKDVIGKYFLIGTAVTVDQIEGRDPKAASIIKNQFNSIVAENCMKPMYLEPLEGKFYWVQADSLVQFGLKNHMKVIGHVLLWHNQTAPWMFKNHCGELPNREEMIQRMHNYIDSVVGHFKGKIFGWDVINEAILEDGSYRKSTWYRAIGPEYFELAFKFAHEADPNAELYYNDYSMSNPRKRASVIKLIKRLKAAGCRIDAVGLQSHNGYNYPNLKEYEKSIQSFIAAGVKVQFTELDINMLPNPNEFGGADISQKFSYKKSLNPYVKGLSKEAQRIFNNQYLAFFKLYRKYAPHVNRVTLWGVSDNNSWLNDWPIPGRTNYPLLFDRKYHPKPIVRDIIKLFK
ncbi:MAG: endo-1,4-beta-xylanase [Prevotella sp.]|jgi:endo-1,4-beta-xylanase|nr:endo-1,4-beta-xylanase [Prevotella sp.]MCH3994398.1 endo-1,4-beta-xylanase [Prevotella sp.]